MDINQTAKYTTVVTEGRTFKVVSLDWSGSVVGVGRALSAQAVSEYLNGNHAGTSAVQCGQTVLATVIECGIEDEMVAHANKMRAL